jgi:hypothetical protein
MPQVTIGCKLPAGLILEHGGKRVTINGATSSVVIGGHGITEGVDKEFFDAWMAAHGGLEFIKAGFLFAHDKANSTAAEAKERAKEATGLEPLNPDAKPANLSEVV